jgi:HSP20 family protein
MITITLRPNSFRTNQLTERPDPLISGWRISSRPHAWRPPTDLYEFDDRIVVRVEIAGMSENDFRVILEKNILIIQGTRQEISERRSYHQMEINFGEFVTAVEIPALIDPQAVNAKYTNGFLWVNLPKTSPKTIPITE